MIRSPHITFADRTCFRTVTEAQEVADLIAVLLDGARAGDGDAMPDSIKLESLSGGRSGAHVFRIVSSQARDHTCAVAPAVLKIATRDAGIAEQRNYERFVRPLLPPSCRPDLLAFASKGGRAALLYSLLGNGERPVTLTDRLLAGDAVALDSVLSSLIDTLWRCWYHPTIARDQSDLSRYYLHRYFGDLSAASAAERVLFEHAARYFGLQRCAEGYRVGDARFPNLTRTLFASGPREHVSCVVHGDLNSDNVVLAADAGGGQLVDFQRVGRGHALQDLVTLEASVRINHPVSMTFNEILYLERQMAFGRPEIQSPHATAIAKIRVVARQFFGALESPGNHHLAVGAVGLRLMRATDLSDAARASIIASALWSAKALSDAETATPPTS
ncbi:phosphotransferase [Rhizorhabdus dicambivorans]|uniref:Ternary complex associated domain-containing protein n=1 Tax=Rhizorhabdus dicambivorans TaxID=1850238 RepID=A0A2A4G0H0_9SPHN|nr:phosphotransferase [Rhizorhabdus dicambivorans]PCE43958.1 hypothetical protein COO09_03295 [Rhizorhabdus dicambivorans]